MGFRMVPGKGDKKKHTCIIPLLPTLPPYQEMQSHLAIRNAKGSGSLVSHSEVWKKVLGEDRLNGSKGYYVFVSLL